MVGTLLALSLPTLAGEAVATVKKASSASDGKIVPVVKPTPHPAKHGEDKELKVPPTPQPPIVPNEASENQIKSNKQTKKVKVQGAADKKPVLVENPSTQK
jgi:hypothetical protein